MLKTKIQQLKEAETKLAAVQQKIEDIKMSILKEVCPYKVGDVIKVVGYAFKGRKAKVTKLQMWRMCDRSMDIEVGATVLKKDGTLSENLSSWYSWYDPNLKEAADKINSFLNQ